ncbi:MAG: DUF4465 domain-containing protein [Saprospiraceae bacterium]
MKNTLLLLLMVNLFNSLASQTQADFENFNIISPDIYLNNAPWGSFDAGNISLPNTYDAAFDYWTGWAISAATDTETPGFTNQYASIVGSGVEGSPNYAVTYASPSSQLLFTNHATGATGFYVTNSTYAYRSMLNGDAFAKQFGGETGDDPDFFLLTIKGFTDAVETASMVEIYLADYRFADNTQDYLLSEWTYVDLTPLGTGLDGLNFYLTSSDNGAFGMNTPAYFCMDNFTTVDLTPTDDRNQEARILSAYPNPATNQCTIPLPANALGGNLVVRNSLGSVVYTSMVSNTALQTIDVTAWSSGLYFFIYTLPGQTPYTGAIQRL